MKGLIDTPGRFRQRDAGIAKGSEITHLAPPAHRVPSLVEELFRYIQANKDPVLVKSCVFHYELEFIHPFTDGNGRMGRLWQNVLLADYYPVFAFLPVETIIRNRQAAYYKALNASDKAGKSTKFIEFMLSVFDECLDELLMQQRPFLSAAERIELFLKHHSKGTFTRKTYMQYFREISAPTASRDLRTAVERKLLIKKGDKNQSLYHVRGVK